MSGTDGDPFTTGAAEAARLARVVQDLGFDTARTIVERFVEIFAQFATTNGSTDGRRPNGGGGQPFRSGASDVQMRALQSDMQRAADAYVAVLGQLNDAGLRFLDATRWWEPAPTEQGELRLPDVAPGGRASARLWLHNTTASPATDLRPWCPGLASHTGASLPATAVTCAPDRIGRLGPDESGEILVTVAIGEDAAPAAYHGQLLVDGLPDVVFPLRARVLPAPNGS